MRSSRSPAPRFVSKPGVRAASKWSALSLENGQFEFRYVPEGAQRLTTNAVGYVPATDAFDLTATAGDRSLAVKLSPAEGLPVRVLNSFGAPVVGATITDGSGSGYSDWITDAEGRASVPIARGESKSVFVLPREGSMAVTNVSAKEGSNPLEEQTITVPKGEVTIDIRTQDTASAAVADVELLLRHNGVVIPDGVARLMFQLQGNLLRTGKTGTAQLRNLPIGSYEFSPYFSRTEYEQLKRGLLPPGTTLVATPGSNSVILTFDHRKQ